MTNMGVSRIAWRSTTSGFGVGTMILQGGTFSFASNNSYFAISERIVTNLGTLVKYGAADVSFSTTSTTDAALQISRTKGTGTLRAVIDKTGFDAIRINSAGVALDVAGNSTLQVALNAGVMLSGSNSFQIIDVETGTVTGTWQNAPTALWTQTTNSSGVSVSLNSSFNRGSIDATIFDTTTNLSLASTIGFVDLQGVSNPLLLRLGLDSSSIAGNNLEAFLTDLSLAGYNPQAFGDYGVDITLDPLLNGGNYFAWDLSGYTHNSQTLQLTSITVIPEPSVALLGGLSSLLLLRRRRSAE